MNASVYTYVKNLQGDIIKILDNTGAAVVSYTYDPWGVPTATGNTTIAEINPCTYRGYDYDEDTGCFYLQSRYYSPSSGRFLCVDAPEMVGMSVLDNHITGANLFSYCNNCPTCASDPTGYYNISYEASWLLNVLFSSIFMLKASGAALLAKVSALIASVAPYLVAVAAVVAVVVISYFSAKKIAVEKAHAKILKTVKKGSSSLYWSASLGWNCVDIGRPLKYAVALSYVKSGKSVFTTTKELAYALAKAAGNGREPTRPEHHGKAKNQPGYYWHYHAYGHKKAHIWYLF